MIKSKSDVQIIKNYVYKDFECYIENSRDGIMIELEKFKIMEETIKKLNQIERGLEN